MPINDAGLQRLQELVPKLMLLADWIDIKSGSIEDEVQRDLRWLSAQLPPLLEQLGQTYCTYCGITFPMDDVGTKVTEHIETCEVHPMRLVEHQLAQAEAEVERLRHFVELVTKLNYREGLGPAPLWHVIEMAKQALSPKEAKDA